MTSRPRFFSGEKLKATHAKKLKGNNRGNTGNRKIKRVQTFESSPILPRQVSFDTPAPTVTLSEESLKQLFNIEVPDDTDITWLNEEKRLKRELKLAGHSDADIAEIMQANKPFGRPQRTLTKRENVASSSLSMSQKIAELSQEVQAGRVENKAQQAAMLGQFALVLDNVSSIEALTNLQLEDLGESLNRIGVPDNPRALGIEPKYFDIEYYNENAGLINLFLFGRASRTRNPKVHNFNLLVRNYAAEERKDGLPAIKLTSTVALMGKDGEKRRFMDIEAGGVINMNQLKRAAKLDVDGFDSVEFSINPEFIT